MVGGSLDHDPVLSKAKLEYVERVLRDRGYVFDHIKLYHQAEHLKLYIVEKVDLRSSPSLVLVLVPEGTNDDRRFLKIYSDYYYLYNKYEDVQLNNSTTVEILGQWYRN